MHLKQATHLIFNQPKADDWLLGDTWMDIGTPNLPRADAPRAPVQWVNPVNGNWSTAADWSTGKVPGANSNVSISAVPTGQGGEYSVDISSAAAAKSLTMDATGAIVVDTALFTLAKNLTITAGMFEMGSGGEVMGGTISAGGAGVFESGSGTLADVKFLGTATIQGNSIDQICSLTITGGTTFAGIGGTGQGAIVIETQYSFLDVLGSGTLNNVALSFGTNFGGFGQGTLQLLDSGASGATLTLGKNLTLDVSGGNSYTIMSASDTTGDMIINHGTLSVTAPYEGVASFLAIDATNFINDGSISVGAGCVLDFIGVSNGTALTNLIDTISNDGGVIAIGADVQGGTITAAGKAGLETLGATLTGVTVQGPIAINGSTIIDPTTNFVGAGGHGPGSIAIAGALLVDGSDTLNNATITFDPVVGGIAPTAPGYLVLYDTGSGGDTLTLGSKLIIDVGSGTIGVLDSTDLAGDVIVNDGTISVARSSELAIDATGFINEGVIDLAAGGLLDFIGTTTAASLTALVATVHNEGGAIGIGGDVTGGTLNGVFAGAGGTLSGVSFQGTLDVLGGIENPPALYIDTGTSFAGLSGVGTATINGGPIQTNGNVTLNNATMNGDSIGDTPGTLTLGSSLTINETGQSYISGAFALENAIVDDATINVLKGGDLTISAASFTDAGTLNLFKGGTLQLWLPLSPSMISDVTNMGGTLEIAGSISGGAISQDVSVLDPPAYASMLEVDSEATVTISAGVTLSIIESNKSNPASAISGQDSTSNLVNDGVFAASGGQGGKVSVAFTNDASVMVSAGTMSFLGSVTNNATMTATGASATLAIGSDVTGTGALDIGASATVSLLDGSGTGQVVDFLTSSGELDLTHPLDFLGAISGFGAGDYIDLEKAEATSFTFANGVLTVELYTTVVAQLNFEGNYTSSSFSLALDGHGGSAITFA